MAKNLILSKKEIISFLRARGAKQEELFQKARDIRKKNLICQKIRGVIEISSYCRKQCNYCPMSCKNSKLKRFRLTPLKIIEIAKEIRGKHISTLFLQSGEDPNAVNIIKSVMPKIKKLGFNEIILNLGDLPKIDYTELKDLGANGYILKQESSNAKIHLESRGYPLIERIRCIKKIKSNGLNLGVGSIIGLPNQTVEDMAEDILFATKLLPAMSSVAPFIPAPETPYEKNKSGNVDYTLNTIALLRILNPKIDIPSVSALEKLRKNGQLQGLMAGANIVTVNFTPSKQREKYNIYGKNRYVVKLNYAKKLFKKTRRDFVIKKTKIWTPPRPSDI